MKKLFFSILVLSLLCVNFVFAETVMPNGYVSPVENDPSDDNFVRAIDQKYGIIFETKRSFNTDAGEYKVFYAEFALDDYNKTDYKLYMHSSAPYLQGNYYVFFKAYNANNEMVAYENRMINCTSNSDLAKSGNISFQIKDNNPKQIARIEFSLNKEGITGEIGAKNYLALSWGENPEVKIFDPENGYSDETRATMYQNYLTSLKERAEEIQKSIDNWRTLTEIG